MDEDDDMLPISLEPQLNEEETLTALQSHEHLSRDDGIGMTYEDLCKAHIVSIYFFFFEVRCMQRFTKSNHIVVGAIY